MMGKSRVPTQVGKAVGGATGLWVWLQDHGRGSRGCERGCRAVSEAAGPWARLQDHGQGCRAVGMAAGQWTWLQSRGHGQFRA